MEPGSCSRPPALSEDELGAALDGFADAVVMEHVSQCPYCTARLTAIQRFERKLHTRLYRHNCPDADALGNYALGMLVEGERAHIENHLTTCLRCTAELQAIHAALSSEDFVVRPVQRAVADADRIGQMIGWMFGEVRSGVGRIVAALLPSPPAATGLALRGSDDVKRLVATTTRGRVLLEVWSEGDGNRLTGQLLADHPAIWSGALVEIYQAGTLTATAILDEMSEFACADLRPIPARVVITPITGEQIVIEEVPFS